MVEVFRTNVAEIEHAEFLIDQIHETLSDYRANFDLDDCDKILRVECSVGIVQASAVIGLLKQHGYSAEVLPDEPPVQGKGMLPFFSIRVVEC